MSPADRINKLEQQRSQLKHAGDYRTAIPRQLEIIQLLEECGSPLRELALAHNYASVLYLRCELYATAEMHARRALRLWSDDPANAEIAGAGNIVLARILAAQYRFEDALTYGERALKNYGVFHNPADNFLSGIVDEVEQIRNRTWTLPEP